MDSSLEAIHPARTLSVDARRVFKRALETTSFLFLIKIKTYTALALVTDLADNSC
jgi:hypothetical protein